MLTSYQTICGKNVYGIPTNNVRKESSFCKTSVLNTTLIMYCKIVQRLHDLSILIEKINIKVHKNASEYFTVTYSHKT